MKRVLSLVLALSMVIGLMTGITFTASAETVTEIDSVDIKGIIAPASGETPMTVADLAAANSGANFTVTGADWIYFPYYDGELYAITTTTFDETVVNYLSIEITANEGYYFNFWTEDVTVNAGTLTYAYSTSYSGDEYDTIGRIIVLWVPDSFQTIGNVKLEGLPTMAAGESISIDSIAAPADAPYTVTDVSISALDSNGDYVSDDLGTTFQDGYCYFLQVAIEPKQGYWFGASVSTADGGETYVSAARDTCYVSYEIDLRPIVWDASLSGLTAAVRGGAAPVITGPAGANYTVSSTCTQDGQAVTTLGIGSCTLTIDIKAAEGYSLEAHLSDILMDGKRIDEYCEELGWSCSWQLYTYEDNSSKYQGMTITLTADVAPENGFIRYTYLKGAPASIQAGEDITVPTITYYPLGTAADALTVTDAKWLDQDGKAVTGKFEDGKVYYLAVTFAAGEGYAFPSSYMYYVDMYSEQGRYLFDTYEIDNTLTTATAYFCYSLMPVVDTVDLTVTVPAVGATPGAPTVPEGAKYSIRVESYEDEEYPCWDWVDEESNESVDTFAENGKYQLEVVLVPADGYDWADWEDMLVTVNGEEIDNWHSYDGNLYVYYTYSFKDAIERVDITMPTLQAGSTCDISDIKVPTDAKYAIDSDNSWWESWGPDEFNGTFEMGNYYYLRLSVHVTDPVTTEFADDPVVYINGVETDAYYSTDDDGAKLYLRYEFDLREVISKVELPALPEIAAGDAVPEADTITVPDGSHYAGGYEWAIYSSSTGSTAPGETFENGKNYCLMFSLVSEQGYRFDDDVVITAGGNELTGAITWVYGDGEYLEIMVMYPVGMKVIDKIEITVSEPVVGQKPGEVTVPEDADYFVYDYEWYAADVDNFDKAEYMRKREVFEADKYYWVLPTLVANEGYVFAADAVVVVNGKTVDMASFAKEYYEGYYVMGDMAAAAGYFDNLLNDNPKTGDSAPIALAAALAVLALGGMAVTVLKKKEF